MPITGSGWEMHINRFRVDVHGSKKRTVGRYRVFHDGNPVPGLTGMTCESRGPGANSPASNGKRIEAKRYSLWTHGGVRYKTLGYTDAGGAAKPMPGIGVRGTGNRSAILIHPGHPPTLFLSSIGCINPTKSLSNAENDMVLADSRARVIALINDLKAYAGASFPKHNGRRIPKTWLVIDNEP